VARVLIVGCGCRGAALGEALRDEHAVRGTTRSPKGLPGLETAGIAGVVADPDRLATLVPALSGVAVVCWLMGTASGSPDVNGPRLRTLMEHLVDTPVRGLVYEGAGTVDPAVLAEGAQIVRAASRTWHIPSEVVSADPADHDAWLPAMKESVERLLSRGTTPS
jgi:nucleoside-diphosphate-sugar epimerase